MVSHINSRWFMFGHEKNAIFRCDGIRWVFWNAIKVCYRHFYAGNIWIIKVGSNICGYGKCVYCALVLLNCIVNLSHGFWITDCAKRFSFDFELIFPFWTVQLKPQSPFSQLNWIPSKCELTPFKSISSFQSLCLILRDVLIRTKIYIIMTCENLISIWWFRDTTICRCLYQL